MARWRRRGRPLAAARSRRPPPLKMTMDVYAQLQQRVKREHGRAFDELVRQAPVQLGRTRPA